MKKFLIYFSLSISVALFSTSLYLYLPNHFDTIDKKLRDMLFINRGAIETTGQVIIIDIDEKSLNEIGQFPWGRDKIATMVYNLALNGIAAVGFDIMFPEADRSSPKKIIYDLGIEDLVPDDKEVDYDEIFASVLSQTPTILGYTFDFNGNQQYLDVETPDIPAIFTQKGKGKTEHLLQPKGVIKNIPIIQDNSYSSGFFNATPDTDGVIRSVPLAMSYDMSVYPSLALELIRAVHQINKLTVNYDELGVRNIELGEFNIPTDIYGRLAVNFRGPSYTFTYISAADIIKNRVDPKELEGKIALVGTSAAGLLDLRNIPYDSIYPGVEVHANVIDNILKGDFLYIPAEASAYNITITLIMSIIVVMSIGYSGAVLLPIIIIVLGASFIYFVNYMLFVEGIILTLFYPLFALVFGALVSIIVNYFLETKQKNLIKGKFASKVSPQVMEDIMKRAADKGNTFIAKEHEITVTFSDIRNFTNISEVAGGARLLIQFLNEYMDEMTQIIMKYEGTVDKFIGDAIMSYWNAPVLVKNHVEKAVDATLDQIHALKPLNAKLKLDDRYKAICDLAADNGVEPIEIGIGINVGVGVVGEMGSSGRSDYTVIGDPVNLGARLESLCKYYNSSCNISIYVKEKIPKGKYIFRFLDLVTVKGQSVPVEIWQIVDYQAIPMKWEGNPLYKASKERLLDELDYYHKGIDLYKNKNFEDALLVFNELESWPDKSNKNIYGIYIQRCEHYIDMPPVDFNGVFKHNTKG
ncbi:CHASE2 domain-containing protein [Sulfurimonas sp.]|uniref:CHASE2 domain-containing protein n=1 Tax=Sulfurimonas sp. TaxID=2022749 RepID=UPI0025FBA658|nr:adenylate/guanylate cyclase domain-containing protein [Sulfurimonas sp.]